VEHDFAGADSLFAAALADMPEDERCRWSDISSLIDGDLADRYRNLDCAGRAALEARWWWLAQRCIPSRQRPSHRSTSRAA